jgi:hypothetical protein
MTQNVNYEITQKDYDEKNEILDIDAYLAGLVHENGVADNDIAAGDAYSNGVENYPDDPSRIAAIELNYMTNYTVKMLSHILDYYKIGRRKLNKTEMVQMLVIFEDDPANEVTVARRRQLWQYMERLHDDEYLSKFILFDGL